ncbi:hypothetical protein RclHR1_01190004 [Rhizophagus clarus]|uniref:Uncharacterized protein n=1 Tax=Rhizophagus clarus TaxID=94130 RepID=A0A2Z6QXD8_9GLOM|nr:hypothetical protein RclHR1_01190004 [Rhizophagus clarus]GET02105.1 hypothetical protein GLOIN_2v1765750 [Rhizophagus clarus]
MPLISRQRHLKHVVKCKLRKKKDETRLKEHHVLHTLIDQLSGVETKRAQHLLSKMRYPTGPQEGQILSHYLHYLQNKVLSFIEDSLYKPLKTDNSLKKTNEDLHRKVQEKFFQK